MNSKTFPFNYDQASAFFSKDLWSSFTGQPASSRSAVAGYAFIGSVCGTNRYSIQEEFGGFQSVTVVTHELGHKYKICIIKSIIKLKNFIFEIIKSFGSVHDGESASPNCPSSNNNIMSPGPLFTNLQNKNLFSSCSITLFKNTLLSNNQ